jgi:hypothetical protein
MLACLEIGLCEQDEAEIKSKHSATPGSINYPEAIKCLAYDKVREEWTYQAEGKKGNGTLRLQQV